MNFPPGDERRDRSMDDTLQSLQAKTLLAKVGVNIFLKTKALLFKGSGERDSTSSVRDDTREPGLTADATTSRVTLTESYTRDDKRMGKNVSAKEHATTISSTGSDVDMKATPLNQTTVPADDRTMQSGVARRTTQAVNYLRDQPTPSPTDSTESLPSPQALDTALNGAKR
ncbi:hypothetical protein R1flu_012413 [Riccia fluitans]|uniref:Uncharacterized protein n=1 Tax=Riccia fluitans TaxID=41844 RepID=A0ABD1ZAJ5_9MARC